MSLVDVLPALGILMVAGWIFYRSFFRKKGPCVECSECPCTKNDRKENDQLISLS